MRTSTTSLRVATTAVAMTTVATIRIGIVVPQADATIVVRTSDDSAIAKVEAKIGAPQGMNAVATTHVAANTTAARLAVIRNERPRTIVLLANATRRNPQATAAYTQWVRTIGRIVRQTPPILVSRSNHPNLVSTRVISSMMTSISRSKAAAAAGAAAAARAQAAAAAGAAATAGAPA